MSQHRQNPIIPVPFRPLILIKWYLRLTSSLLTANICTYWCSLQHHINPSARRRKVFLSLKKIWLIGKSPYLRYWGKRPKSGFSGFSPLHPFPSTFSQSIKYQQVAQNMGKKVLITGGVPIQSSRGQKAVISNSVTPTPASFTLACSVCNLLQLWPYFGLENAHYAPWGFF